MGHGALIYPAKEGADCYEGSYFAAYKNYYQGVYGYYDAQKVVFSFMTMIDNRNGFGASLKIPDAYKARDYADINIQLNDNKIYGECEASDCPADGSFCKPVEKYGLIISGASHNGKDLHINDQSPLPVPKFKSLSAWGTIQQMYRNEFIGFDSKTSEGLR